MYVVDTNMSYFLRSICTTINAFDKDLQLCRAWLNEHKLSLNVEGCKYAMISMPFIVVAHISYIGAPVNQFLNWDKHIYYP